MTEQQIRQLKNILDTSNAPGNSSELDDRILQASARKAVLLKQSETHPLLRLLSSNALSAVALSLFLTAGVFIVLSLIVKTDSQPYLVERKAQPIEIDFGTVSDSSAEDVLAGIGVAELSEQSRLSGLGDLSSMRDKILAQMILPDVQDVINEMEFILDADRALAEQSLQLAMNDIRSFIGQGRLDNARQRYEKLRQACDVCMLPSTLEALVMSASTRVDSS